MDTEEILPDAVKLFFDDEYARAVTASCQSRQLKRFRAREAARKPIPRTVAGRALRATRRSR